MTSLEVTALLNIMPDADFEIEDDKITWNDTRPMPSQEEIDAEVQRILDEQKKYEKIEKLQNQCTDYIYFYYSPVKQQSDISDKEYYVTILKSKGSYNNLEQLVFNMIVDFLKSTKSIKTIIQENNIPLEDHVAFEQLIKTGIRVNWVQQCKKELANAIANNVEPNYPEFPDVYREDTQ